MPAFRLLFTAWFPNSPDLVKFSPNWTLKKIPMRGHLGSTLELRGCRSPMGSPAFEPPNASLIHPQSDEVSVASSEAILTPLNAEKKAVVRKEAKKKVRRATRAYVLLVALPIFFHILSSI